MVVGLANTGLAVTRFLKDRGAEVTVSDLMTRDELGQSAEAARSLGASLRLGGHNPQDFLSQSMVVLSPGVPHTIDAVKACHREGIPVIGEVELAARHIAEPIVAITGTNGKTTTTELVGKMLEHSGMDVFIGGNIGNPLIEYVSAGRTRDVVVAEISSFQLDTIETFKPKVAILLNVTDDHLDRYDNYESYLQSKGSIFKNQNQEDYAILNGADAGMTRLVAEIDARILYFNPASHVEPGARLNGRTLHCRLTEGPTRTFDLSQFRLPGRHNQENVAAASLAALSVGASEAGISTALRTFPLMRHRLEYIATVGGVHYYNDSKGTNVGAVARALESFDVPVVLIMGGRDKGGDYRPLGQLLRTRVRQLIVMGEAQPIIKEALGGTAETRTAPTLSEAVRMASEAAVEGDVVLLSPGCSSFDMFRDYAHRGEVFCEAVKSL